MNDQKAINLAGAYDRELGAYLKERLVDAGPPSESGCGDAERRNDQRPTNLPHGSAVVEAKDGGELQRVIQQIEEEAAENDRAKATMERNGRAYAEGFHMGMAAGLRTATFRFMAAVKGDPRTQSGEDEVEECRCPTYSGAIFSNPIPRCYTCHKPIPARGKRKERSGLHNDQAHRPR